jgi:FixJ family two-component response regulator
MMEIQELILVLDDDASTLRSIKRLLKLHGFDVEGFDTVKSFLGDASLSRARCLVLDIHLKGMSGIEVKRKLSHIGISLPVIFITGKESEANRKAALDVGCVAFLPKPFPAKSLISAVHDALASTA